MPGNNMLTNAALREHATRRRYWTAWKGRPTERQKYARYFPAAAAPL